ncbi:MAG: hypothetical protein R3C27_03635 [Hyphomonadaceae bacterium]
MFIALTQSPPRLQRPTSIAGVTFSLIWATCVSATIVAIGCGSLDRGWWLQAVNVIQTAMVHAARIMLASLIV